MKKLFGIFLPALIFIFLVGGILPQKAQANHSWSGYHWYHNRVPLQIRLADNVSPSWKPYLSRAAYDWNRSSMLDVFVVGGGTSPSSCKMRAGTVQVCNWTYGSTGWLGLAQLTANGKIITAATVKLNDSYFSQARFNNTPWKQLVTCQEVGHALGLTHQDENFNNAPLGSCMDYSNDPNPNQYPNYHDYVQLWNIYATMDNAFYSDNAVDDHDYTGKNEWGALVGGSDSGAITDNATGSPHYAVFERDLGAGKKLNTVVFWVQ